jgi:hypothetical protein
MSLPWRRAATLIQRRRRLSCHRLTDAIFETFLSFLGCRILRPVRGDLRCAARGEFEFSTPQAPGYPSTTETGSGRRPKAPRPQGSFRGFQAFSHDSSPTITIKSPRDGRGRAADERTTERVEPRVALNDLLITCLSRSRSLGAIGMIKFGLKRH